MSLEKRVKNIYNNIEKKPDVILIKNSNLPFIDENFFYTTGLDKGIFEGCVAVLFPDGNIDLIITDLESEIAKKANVNVKVYENPKEYEKLLKDSISSSKSIGLNFKGISIKDFLKINKRFLDSELIDISPSITKTRLTKDEQEIELIKKACNIVDKVKEKIPEFLNSEIHEYELAAEIDYLMQKNGADNSAFETISSFGENSSQPHYTHGDRKIRNGDFVLCDYGACFKKYNSDITRTFVFGKANDQQKDMYQTVLEAQKVAFDMIKPGIKAYEVHNKVEKTINETKFKDRFIHSTGHSLGLMVHDGARISEISQLELEENMVFTIEPGVYIPGFGGVRIEDDVLIKKDGVELLTKSSRELIEI